MTPLKRNATYDDLCAVSELFIAELIGGDLYASRRPPIRFGHAASALAFQLGWGFRVEGGGPGAWLFLNKPEIHLREDAIVPDIAAWRRDRLPKELPDYLTLAPDWLCEVLAPNTEALDRTKKLAVYAREGVRHVWLVNPLIQTLEVPQLEGQRWYLLAAYESEATVRAEPFESIELALGELWLPDC